jgi:hypothetical protein
VNSFILLEKSADYFFFQSNGQLSAILNPKDCRTDKFLRCFSYPKLFLPRNLPAHLTMTDYTTGE